MPESPNVILIFGDQWRAQAFGYAGNTCVQTPNIDRLASQSINATHGRRGGAVRPHGRIGERKGLKGLKGLYQFYNTCAKITHLSFPHATGVVKDNAL